MIHFRAAVSVSRGITFQLWSISASMRDFYWVMKCTFAVAVCLAVRLPWQVDPLAVRGNRHQGGHLSTDRRPATGDRGLIIAHQYSRQTRTPDAIFYSSSTHTHCDIVIAFIYASPFPSIHSCCFMSIHLFVILHFALLHSKRNLNYLYNDKDKLCEFEGFVW